MSDADRGLSRAAVVAAVSRHSNDVMLRRLAECLQHEDCGSQRGSGFRHQGDHWCPHYNYADWEFYGGNLIPVGRCEYDLYDILNMDDESFIEWVLDRWELNDKRRTPC